MQIWAVARQMIAEGIRMKIALVFLVLVGLVVVGLPFSIAGDSSLTGAIQSFMSYGFAATSLLLGILTVFLSRSLADELVHHQILMVMTKPIPRWQFILGKWLGITTLNAVFLLAAGLTIYAMVGYIRMTHPPLEEQFDKQELTNEVLVARHAARTKLPDFTKPAKAELQKNLEQGVYDNLPAFDADEEVRRLSQKYEARWRIVQPLNSRIFEFETVLCDRSPSNFVQIRYKTVVSQYAPDEMFRAFWRIGNPAKGTPLYEAPTRHVIDRYHVVRVPANAVAEDHTLTVRFYHETPYEGEPQYRNVIEFRKANEVEVLFVVGSFEWNIARLLVLMMCKLMFLAGVAVLMTAVFSFPVACLASFTVYVLAGARSFLEDALDMSSDDTASMFSSVHEFLVQSVTHLFHMMNWLVPNFGYYDAVETLVNGRNVSLVWVLQGIGELVLLKTAVILGLASLLFYRREVAEVSV